ncbi:MAG: hypothetical protein AB1772_09600 [Candidatus Zixiibacteriota bacterium]
MTIKQPLVLFAFFILSLCTTMTVYGQNLLGNPTGGRFGVKVGVVSRMKLTTTPTRSSEIGSCAQVYIDLPQGRQFFLSPAFDFYYIEINRANQIMIEANLGLKRTFGLKRARMLLGPGVSVGFLYLSEIGDLPDSRFMSLKAFVETHFAIDARRAWVGELAWIYAPTGSNSDESLSFGPGVMLRWGLALR